MNNDGNGLHYLEQKRTHEPIETLRIKAVIEVKLSSFKAYWLINVGKKYKIRKTTIMQQPL